MPIYIDSEKLVLNSGVSLRWDEIVAMHASKYDAIERESILIELDYTHGDFVEINIEEDEFSQLRHGLRRKWDAGNFGKFPRSSTESSRTRLVCPKILLRALRIGSGRNSRK